MAIGRAGKNNSVLSSVLLQILLYLSAAFSVFYFLSTLSMIIYKTHVLSYPVDRLALDVCLLFLMAGLEVLRVYWGFRGNLQESEGYTGSNLITTGATVLLALYFVIWQSYVLRADVIIGAILLCFYGLTGIVGLWTLARFTSVYS
ncbi:transmembrane protein 80-like [Siphateles boraxobius]|uniref:transmembrane protein 80-like n=1 Tax=Siphateles boraxobius TaxID=180520 RepID=UPI0040637FAA